MSTTISRDPSTSPRDDSELSRDDIVTSGNDINLQYSRNQIRGTALALLSAAMFALLGFMGTSLVHDHFSIENMLFWRFLVASIWIFSFIILTRREKILPTIQTPGIARIFCWAALTYSSSSALYFVTCLRIGTGLAMVLFYAFPIFVAIMGWFSGTWRLSKLATAAFLAVIVGMMMLKGNGHSSIDWSGIFLGLLAAFLYACYMFSSNKTLNDLDTAVLTLLTCMGNTIIFLFLSLLKHSFIFPATTHDWLFICGIGVLVTALPIQFLLDGLKYISPVQASAISVVEPILTIVLGLVLLHESMSLMQSMGIVIVLIGALMLQFESPIEGTSNAKPTELT